MPGMLPDLSAQLTNFSVSVALLGSGHLEDLDHVGTLLAVFLVLLKETREPLECQLLKLLHVEPGFLESWVLFRIWFHGQPQYVCQESNAFCCGT